MGKRRLLGVVRDLFFDAYVGAWPCGKKPENRAGNYTLFLLLVLSLWAKDGAIIKQDEKRAGHVPFLMGFGFLVTQQICLPFPESCFLRSETENAAKQTTNNDKECQPTKRPLSWSS